MTKASIDLIAFLLRGTARVPSPLLVELTEGPAQLGAFGILPECLGCHCQLKDFGIGDT